MKRWMNDFVMKRGINWWPPFLGSGIKVERVDQDFTKLEVVLHEHFYNRNVVGVHFGGSLYAMCDPFYMGILMHHLGKDFIVWDKGATINFKKPGRGSVRAIFEITPSEIEAIKAVTLKDGKHERWFKTNITDANGQVIAEVAKLLYIRDKNWKKPS